MPQKKRYRRFIDQPQKMTITQIIGAVILFSGIILLTATVLVGISKGRPAAEQSSVIAVGFLQIMLGLALFYPDLLEGPRQSVSSMRVIVYMIVCVFVFLTVKIGWGAASFADFTLDRTWAYVLAIALGSKAMQSLGENNWLGKRNAPGTAPDSNPGLGDDDDPGPTQDDPVRSDEALQQPPQNLKRKIK